MLASGLHLDDGTLEFVAFLAKGLKPGFEFLYVCLRLCRRLLAAGPEFHCRPLRIVEFAAQLRQ